jgi:hypothetical protein
VPYILSDVADSAQHFYRRRRQPLNFFSDVGDSAKNYKTAIIKPKPSKFLVLQ